MGFISGVIAIKKVSKIKAGGRATLSISDITNLIINLQDAKRNLSVEEFQAVHTLFSALQKARTKMELNLDGYCEEALTIIGIFNKIAPYELYSGMEKTESLFFMEDAKTLLVELEPRSESLLSAMRNIEPKLDMYFRELEKNIEDRLIEFVDKHKQKEYESYIDYIIQSGQHFNITRNHAKAFFGILLTAFKFGKTKALALMDQLFIYWINTSDASLFNLSLEIPFLCGILYPNDIVSKEESDHLSSTYTDIVIERLT